MMPGAPERMMKMERNSYQVELAPTTLRLTAERLIASSRCKHNCLEARNADSCVNWGDFGGTLTGIRSVGNRATRW